MRINSKGFILIETLAVTVFAASIFVFLFKSVAPLMGYYETRMEQMGNIDSVFNNYTLRKFIYRDEYFNNKNSLNYDASHQYAIKDLNYTLIRCKKDPTKIRTGITGQDQKLESLIYSVDYCDSLMEHMGARENGKNHYLIFYVKSTSLKDFADNGIRTYKSYKIKFDNDNPDYPTPVFDDQDTVDLFKNAIKEITGNSNFKPDSSKAYLIFYYLYPNPMYEKSKLEPVHKESINIVPMTPSNDNTNCFKVQLIPGYQYFYKYPSDSPLNSYYFYHDNFNYKLYQNYYDDVNACATSNTIKNRYQNDADARAYCQKVFLTNNQFYTIYKLTNMEKCQHYFKDKVVEGNKVNPSEFCGKKFNNLDLPNDWNNFVDARFAERVLELKTITPEVAIIGYDKSCSKDVIIPSTLYGYQVTVIGYEAFKNTGIRSINVSSSNLRVIDKNAVSLFGQDAISNYVNQIKPNSSSTQPQWKCVGGNGININNGCFGGVLIKK